jgi:hypothetical protein
MLEENIDCIEVLQKHYDAFMARDMVQYLDNLHEDIVIDDDQASASLTGRDAVRRFFEPLFARDIAQRVRVLARMQMGPYVVDKVLITGRPAGPFPLIEIFKILEGKIVHIRVIRSDDVERTV